MILLKSVREVIKFKLRFLIPAAFQTLDVMLTLPRCHGHGHSVAQRTCVRKWPFLVGSQYDVGAYSITVVIPSKLFREIQ